MRIAFTGIRIKKWIIADMADYFLCAGNENP
jgi:hypothetical protein